MKINWAAGLFALIITLYVQGDTLHLTGEMCVNMYEIMNSADMICFDVDNTPGDGATTYECVVSKGDNVKVIVWGEV